MNKTKNIIILLIIFPSLLCIAQNLDRKLIHIEENIDGVLVNGFLTESRDTIIPVGSHRLFESYNGEPLIILNDTIGTKVYNTFGDIVFKTDSLVYFGNSGLDSVLYTFVNSSWRLFNINHKNLLEPKFKGISHFQNDEALVLAENDSIYSISPNGNILYQKKLSPGAFPDESIYYIDTPDSFLVKIFPTKNYTSLLGYLEDMFALPKQLWRINPAHIRIGGSYYGDTQMRYLSYHELENGWIFQYLIGFEYTCSTLRINRISFYDAVALIMSIERHDVEKFHYENGIFKIYCNNETVGATYEIRACGDETVEIKYEVST